MHKKGGKEGNWEISLFLHMTHLLISNGLEVADASGLFFCITMEGFLLWAAPL